MTTLACIALGGNIDPERRLRQAALLLRRAFPGIVFSHAYRNPAVGFRGADFINAAARLTTSLEPAALLAALHAIEEQCGRGRDDPKWAPRAMDLDLLLFADRVQDLPGLTLPRRDLLKRAYMLGPLAEIAPALVHPTARKTLAELWHEFPAEGVAALTRVALDLNGV